MNGIRPYIEAAAKELEAETGGPSDRPGMRALAYYVNGKSFEPGWGLPGSFDAPLWTRIAEDMGVERPEGWHPLLWAANIKGQISLLAIPGHHELPDGPLVENVRKWFASALKLVP